MANWGSEHDMRQRRVSRRNACRQILIKERNEMTLTTNLLSVLILILPLTLLPLPLLLLLRLKTPADNIPPPPLLLCAGLILPALLRAESPRHPSQKHHSIALRIFSWLITLMIGRRSRNCTSWLALDDHCECLYFDLSHPVVKVFIFSSGSGLLSNTSQPQTTNQSKPSSTLSAPRSSTNPTISSLPLNATSSDV